jgi:hypothetical protein
MFDFILGWIGGGLSWKGNIFLVTGIIAVLLAALLLAAF